MGRDLTQDEQTQLEQLVDAAGLCAVLQSLSEVCEEKADHVQSSYDDPTTARAWRSASGVIGCCSADGHVMRVGEP